MKWQGHLIKAGPHSPTLSGKPSPNEHREHVEPWLSALFQAEHLNVLIGSGFTQAIALAAGAPVVDMSPVALKSRLADEVNHAARHGAKLLGREEPNIEDQLRTVIEFIGGLRILAGGANGGESTSDLGRSAAKLYTDWTSELGDALSDMVKRVLATERGICAALTSRSDGTSDRVRWLLGGFLLPFGSRTATRERAHVFTVNYDRLIEYGCDLLALRIVDRFVGTLAPVFRSSRLGIDLHYNPPGIRGEPRYLEGVVRLTKLHGSVDWLSAKGPSGSVEVQRTGLPIGATEEHPSLPTQADSQLLIYPNAAKDVETLEYPYAELFRDFAAAACQPNSVLVTYGYGFGADHINRVLRDMLSIPSTHLVIISYDDAKGRLPEFYKGVGRETQITLLVGDHFGSLEALVEHYLPKPAIDRTTWRMVDLLNRRVRPKSDDGMKSSLQSAESENKT